MYYSNGYIASVVITAKIIMQKIWLEKTDWDAKVAPTIQNEWKQSLVQLPDLNSISMPRWLGMKRTWKSELHDFSDASESA